MTSSYSEFAPVIILLAFVLLFIIGHDIKKDSLKSIDGFLAVLGIVFGFFMTLMNLNYTSEDLFLLSPVILLSCIFYLRYRSKFKKIPDDFLRKISNQQNSIPHNIILNIIWWCLTVVSLFAYYVSDIYTRKPLFFVLVSVAVAILGVQIITSNVCNKTNTTIFIIKILYISIILRYSAYFISPYPIGSDPWEHNEYIKYFIDFGRIAVPAEFLYYYVNFPIAHLYVVCTALITSISTHAAMFFLGVILTFSTIVTFLLTRMLTGNIQLALLSMLILNFIDVHILWSVEVIAMSFGIVIYAFIIYIFIYRYSNSMSNPNFAFFLLIFLFLSVFTHTIGAFITLISLVVLVVAIVFCEATFNRSSIRSHNLRILITPPLLLAIIIWCRWTDPSYLFFETIFNKLVRSLSQEAAFLGAISLSNITGRWEELFQPMAFCIYVFFGIIGTLYCLSDKKTAYKYIPLIFIILMLFVIRYAFPIFGIRNIIPSRWPVFAFISFALFIAVGMYCSLNLLKTKTSITCAVAIIFLTGSFFMITNPLVNNDSPLFGGTIFPKLVWTESEMIMYAHINSVYDGIIIADEHTRNRPFEAYLKNNLSKPYRITSNGMIDNKRFSEGLVIWREDSLKRPTVFASGNYVVSLLLDERFLRSLDGSHNRVCSTKTATCYTPRSKI